MKHLITILLLLPAITMWGQEDNGVYLDDFDQVEVIVSKWADKPLRIKNTFAKVPLRNFAQAFCTQYQNYEPNHAMMDYLKKPGNYTWEEKGYYSEEDVRNGYLKIDDGGQFDHSTEICYWKRPNGHALIGILMEKGYEGETIRYALLFYDYNPKTGMMTPDMEIWRSVNQYLQSHKGSCFIDLPREGKNITFTSVYWDPAEDFIYHNYILRWTGNGFVQEKGVE